MFTETFNGAQAWTSSTAGAPSDWYLHVPDECLSTIEEFLQSRRTSSVPLIDHRLDPDTVSACHACMAPALDDLNSGRGFFLIRGDQFPERSDDERLKIYWALGQMLGDPFDQDLKGTLLYDVRDTGTSVTKGARFSVTNAESSFHMDNTMGENIPDYVGLLCLQQARSGGQSQLISSCTIHNELLKNHPRELETLYETFCFDRRGLFTEGEPPVNRVPVFNWDGDELTARYLRYYIDAGHETVGEPLTAKQKAAIDTMDALLARPDLRVEFHLQPGDILFVNNRRILHNRTAFEDHAEIEKRRHCVRLWLSRFHPSHK